MAEEKFIGQCRGGRVLYFDVLKIVACLMVMLVHTSAMLVIDFPQTDGIVWKYINFFNCLGRAAVPLFIMISGALLLDEHKNFDVKKFYGGSFLWMVMLLVGWMVFYGVFYSVAIPLLNHEAASISKFVGYLLTFEGSNCPHLWYMFLVVGIYAAVPVFRCFVKVENKGIVKGIIIAGFATQFFANSLNIIPAYFNYPVLVTDFVNKFYFNVIGTYVCPFLLGWYLANFDLSRTAKNCLYGAGIISFAASTVCVQFLIEKIPAIRWYASEHFSAFALIQAVALFVFVKTVCGDKTSSKCAGKISCITMGVYLIHVMFVDLFFKFIWIYSPEKVHPVLYLFVFYLFVIFCSFATSYLISKIKGIRKIIYVK